MSSPGKPAPPKPDNNFKLHLQRWEANVRSRERIAWDTVKVAADFGKLGLISAFLLNGGALVAVPSLMHWLDEGARKAASGNAQFFICGILLAATAIVIAYLNFMFASTTYNALAQKRACELNAQYRGVTVVGNPDHAVAVEAHRKSQKMAMITQWLAITVAVGSFVFFSCGAVGLVSLAERTTDKPKVVQPEQITLAPPSQASPPTPVAVAPPQLAIAPSPPMPAIAAPTAPKPAEPNPVPGPGVNREELRIIQ